MRETIHIIDSQTGQPIDAEIFDEITVEHFIETKADWRPVGWKRHELYRGIQAGRF
jgi:hypothetical protein